MTRFLSSLRFRLLLLVLLALVPALGLIIHTASEQRRLAGIQAQEDALRLARTAANSQEQLIGNAQQLLAILAQVPAVRDRAPEACNQTLANLLAHDPRFTAIAVVELEGTSKCRAVPPNDSNSTTISTPALQHVYAQALETRDAVVGEYGIGPYSGRGILAFACPILDASGQVAAVLTLTLDVASLNRLAARSLLPPGSTLTENDRNGTIVARFPDPEKWVGRPAMDAPIVQIILNQRHEGTTEAIGEDGVSRLYAFTPLRGEPNNEIYVSVGIPTAVAFAEVNRILEWNLMAFALVAILALGAAWIGSDLFLLRQVKGLLDMTGRLASGVLGARTERHPGVGELGQLAYAFDRMVDALKERDRERRQAEDQVRRQAARAEALVRAAGRLGAQLDLDRVLEGVCEESAQALHGSAASVSLYDVNRDVFCLAACYGMPSDDAGHVPPVPRQAFEPWISQSGSTIIFDNLLQLPDVTEDAARLDVRAVVRASMLHERRLIGVVSVFACGETREWGDEDRMLLTGLGAQAALAITNARLYQILQHEEHTRAELLHQVITAQEDERMRIARELHDETSQGLTAVIVGLDTAHMALLANNSRTDDYMQSARTIAKRMLEDIRRLISDLRPTLLDDMGLVPAIAWYGEKRLEPAGITLHLDRGALHERLPSEMETVLFRIVQEALTNVVRHSHASSVHVRLKATADLLTLQIADDGQGFELSPHWLDSRAKEWGLRGMRERVRILGGEMDLSTRPGQGTVITVRVPLATERIHLV